MGLGVSRTLDLQEWGTGMHAFFQDTWMSGAESLPGTSVRVPLLGCKKMMGEGGKEGTGNEEGDMGGWIVDGWVGGCGWWMNG